MKIQEFYDRVKKEVNKLRKLATKEELNRLNVDTLSAFSTSSCIYGQITTDCFSDRAAELIEKCCVKNTSFSELPDSDHQKKAQHRWGVSSEYDTSYSFSQALKVLVQSNILIPMNICPLSQAAEWGGPGRWLYPGRTRNFSYLEVYLTFEKEHENNAGLIAYLKGEIDEWEPKIVNDGE